MDSNHRSRRQQIYSLPPLATRELLRIYLWSWWTDSNPRPADYKSAALPTELHQRIYEPYRPDFCPSLSAHIKYHRNREMSSLFFKFRKKFFPVCYHSQPPHLSLRDQSADWSWQSVFLCTVAVSTFGDTDPFAHTSDIGHWFGMTDLIGCEQ